MTERPHAYLRVADHLREQITSGEVAPGVKLPPQRVLAEEHGVSDILIRRALEILRNEGLIESRQGSGTYVRVRPPVRRISMDRYLADAGPQTSPQTSFTRDQGITWSQYRLDKAYRWTTADERLADLFGVAAGDRVLERRFVFYAAGLPSQMSRSCLLAADVEGTPVADPHNEPWPGGNIGQLRTLGIEIDRIAEETAARMPTPEEAERLGIASGVPVFSITRLMYAQERVVEVADPIVIPADRAVRVDHIVL
ncbi:GntR family transcriptional regulator [Streptosporangium sp. NBC_01755]|uniref:GntR family transcriptional regulator n=1 Tax=unclassified Streptosporangium TaxID=2632669 RepID=UPI002DD89E11|nr:MULTISPECIES: GntR family transcriptional regulator [unclassified Streptosporangium]WSA24704.1 GntR family transcriptional regulator [Streptosporangium sp. NBC_01810]WSC97219.1 GntR family transcriptional regulator [Streptosporangium sp. NBC_01755]